MFLSIFTIPNFAKEIYPHKHSYQYYIPSETIASDDNNGTTCMLSNSIILQFLLVSNVYFEICTNLKSKYVL